MDLPEFEGRFRYTREDPGRYLVYDQETDAFLGRVSLEGTVWTCKGHPGLTFDSRLKASDHLYATRTTSLSA